MSVIFEGRIFKRSIELSAKKVGRNSCNNFFFLIFLLVFGRIRSNLRNNHIILKFEDRHEVCERDAVINMITSIGISTLSFHYALVDSLWWDRIEIVLVFLMADE